MAGKKGRSGRKRKPLGLHLVDGTHRKDRHGPAAAARKKVAANRQEPIPTAPNWLSPSAKQEWRRVAKKLHARGDLSMLDRAVLTTYCQSWGEYRAAELGRLHTLKAARVRLTIDPGDAEAAQIVAYEATLIPTAEGGWVRNPSVVVANAASNRMNAAGRDLGLTPNSHVAPREESIEDLGRDFPADMADDPEPPSSRAADGSPVLSLDPRRRPIGRQQDPD